MCHTKEAAHESVSMGANHIPNILEILEVNNFEILTNFDMYLHESEYFSH